MKKIICLSINVLNSSFSLNTHVLLSQKKPCFFQEQGLEKELVNLLQLHRNTNFQHTTSNRYAAIVVIMLVEDIGYFGIHFCVILLPVDASVDGGKWSISYFVSIFIYVVPFTVLVAYYPTGIYLLAYSMHILQVNFVLQVVESIFRN